MKNDGGPAFPNILPETIVGGGWDSGMSLRDYFAIHAPEPSDEIVKNNMAYDRNRNPHNDPPPKPQHRSEGEIKAHMRYAFADAMLAERAKVPT